MTLRCVLAITLCVAAFLTSRAEAGQRVTIPAADRVPDLPAYVARPAGDAAAPGVLVLHGCEGYTPRYGAIADWLASNGYVAVAIDSLEPQGRKNACGDRTQSGIQAADARAALAWMRAQSYIDPAKLAIVGYSMGAIATLDVIDSRAIATAPPGLLAAVTYYPACSRRDASRLLVPLRILDGSADDWTPAPPCRKLAANAKVAGKTVVITTYPDATHAFNIDLPDRTVLRHHLSYNAPAATDAEMQTLAFLHQYLRGKP